MLTHAGCGTQEIAAIKDFILSSLDDDKALDVEVIDISGQSALADYIIVASGTSSRQIVRMAEKLAEKLQAQGHTHIRMEGLSQANWVVVDAGDVIVHLFKPEVREFYSIEKMWKMPIPGGDTKKVGLKSA